MSYWVSGEMFHIFVSKVCMNETYRPDFNVFVVLSVR